MPLILFGVLENVSRIKDFVLLRKLGEGGYGVVYLAKKDGVSGYKAIKIVPVNDAEKELVGLKKYLSISDKENFAPIEEYGISDGKLFYSMPLADSLFDGSGFSPEDFRWREKSLQKLIDERNNSSDEFWFSPEEIISYIKPLFNAAIIIGEAGLLHRDIKPDNALFFGGRLKLTDFGLLTIDNRSVSNLGTPFYIAPSWYVAKGGNPDAYGLATTFYTLITGNLPDTMGRPAYRFPEKKIGDSARWLHWNR